MTEKKPELPLTEETARVQEITQLHEALEGYVKKSLANALRIGQLLDEQKQALPHGAFTAWVQAHLPFTDRTARNYMRLHRHRDRLKTETVSDLNQAYQLLNPPKGPARVEQVAAELDRSAGEGEQIERDSAWQLGRRIAIDPQYQALKDSPALDGFMDKLATGLALEKAEVYGYVDRYRAQPDGTLEVAQELAANPMARARLEIIQRIRALGGIVSANGMGIDFVDDLPYENWLAIGQELRKMLSGSGEEEVRAAAELDQFFRLTAAQQKAVLHKEDKKSRRRQAQAHKSGPLPPVRPR